MKLINLILLLVFPLIVLGSNKGLDVTIKSTSNGEINGKVSDAGTGEALIGATVVASIKDRVVSTAITDFDGFYVLKPLEPGLYDLSFSYLGYEPVDIKMVPASSNNMTTVNADLNSNSVLDTLVVRASRVIEYQNLFGPIDTGSGAAFTEQEIKKLPVRTANDIASLGAGIYQEDSGDVFQVRGSRTGATRLMVDGNYVDDFNSIPNSAIAEMQVLTGGIPAKYGDTTGGVVIITTKGYRMMDF